MLSGTKLDLDLRVDVDVNMGEDSDLQWDGYLAGWEEDGYPHNGSHDLQWDGYFPGWSEFVELSFLS